MRPVKWALCSTLVAITALPTVVYADDVANTTADPRNYGDAPHSGLKLGHGISARNVNVGKMPCIIFQEERIDPAAANSTITVSFVRDQQQLLKTLDVDVKAQASAWGASADFGMSKSLSMKFSADSAVLLVTASSDFGRWGLKATPKAELTPEAQTLLADPRVFEDKCGSRYVNLEWRSASVSAIITIANISSDLREAIKMNFGASGSYGAVSGSLKAAFASELSKAAKQSRVTSAVHAKGGMGVEGLGNLVTASISGADPLGEIGKTLAAYIKNINASNAFPVAYQVRSMSDFGWRPEAMLLWTDDEERFTRSLFESASLVEADRVELKAMIDGQSPWIEWAEINGFGKGAAQKELVQLGRDAEFWRSTYDSCVEHKGGFGCPDELLPPYRSRIVAIANQTPKVVFKVYKHAGGQSLELTTEASRVVLSAPPEQRDIIAGQFNPEFNTVDVANASKLIAAIRPEGQGLVSQQIVFVAEDGVITDVYPETASQQMTWYNANTLDPDPSLEAGVRRFMAGWGGTHAGTFAVQLRDIAGRVTTTPIVDSQWTSENGTVRETGKWKILTS